MKPLSGGVLLLAGLGLSAIWLSQPVASENPEERRAARQQQQVERYEIKRARRDAFASFVEDICDAIEVENLRLADASERVLTYSESFYPDYLRHLEMAEPATSPKERVARNLLCYFTTLARQRPERANPELIARLEGELTAFAKDQ